MDNFENKTPNQEPEKKQETGRQPQGAPKVEPQKVYYRPSQQYQDQSQQRQNQDQQYRQYQNDPRYVPQGNYQQMPPRKGMPTWLRVLLIVVLIFILIMYLMTSCVASIGKAFNTTFEESGIMGSGTDVTTANATGEYVGVLHIEGTISESGTSSAYNHKYLLRSLEDMAKDDNNKGVILYLNTPGGSVYASDELYFAIKDYQEKTKRPVYSSMQSMAASGGYYISAPCDKIYANRNCFTGSIGVTMGEYYDVSELLEKYGVKVHAITSGRNKAMGSYTQEMTDEQLEILQGLVDEAYDQFTELVAEGRNMDIKKVRELADGRIYTARQAKDNGLIDEIGTYEECKDAMKTDFALGADIQFLDFWPAENNDLRSYLGIISEELDKDASVLTADQIQELMDLNGDMKLMCMYRG